MTCTLHKVLRIVLAAALGEQMNSWLLDTIMKEQSLPHDFINRNIWKKFVRDAPFRNVKRGRGESKNKKNTAKKIKKKILHCKGTMDNQCDRVYVVVQFYAWFKFYFPLF